MVDLGYVYNRSAANMRKSNAGLIGLVINDLRNPFFTEFATSLQMTLSEKGYATVLANTDEDPKLQEQVVNSMIEHGVSALIICPAYGQTAATFDAVARAGVPTMQLLRCVDDRLNQFPCTAPDYPLGSEKAVRHLFEMGASRVAFVGGMEGRAGTQERKSGYMDVLGEVGMSPVVLTGEASRDFGRKAAALLFEKHPAVDAAVCYNDLVALGMLSGFQEIDQTVGDDFLIVGFDDIEEAAQVYPAISSVSCDIVTIGAQAAATIVNWLEENKRPANETRTPVRLSIRQPSLGNIQPKSK